MQQHSLTIRCQSAQMYSTWTPTEVDGPFLVTFCGFLPYITWICEVEISSIRNYK